MKASNKDHNLAVRIARGFAKFDVGHVLLAVMAIGMVLALVGIMLNTHDQVELYQTGGAAAINAYNFEMQAVATKPLPTYLLLGVVYQLPSGGDNLEALGLVVCFALAPGVATLSIALRRVFSIRMLDDWALASILPKP